MGNLMLWGTGQVGRGHDNQRAHLEERQSNFPDQGQNLCPLHYRALTEYRNAPVEDKKSAIVTSVPRTVSKIMVFYSDGTFEER